MVSPIAREFPEFKSETTPRIPKGWKDVSWHNDACPSYMVGTWEGRHAVIFIDFEDPDDRETPGFGRFVANCCVNENDDWTHQHESDDWEFIVARVTEWMAEG